MNVKEEHLQFWINVYVHILFTVQCPLYLLQNIFSSGLNICLLYKRMQDLVFL